MKRIILLKMGEMVLKGLNRSRFEQMLIAVLRARLAVFGAFEILSMQSAIYIIPSSAEKFDITAAFEVCSKVFGIASLSIAIQTQKEMTQIRTAALSLPELTMVKTFKVQAKRSDKLFAYNSPQICADIGACVLKAYQNISVDVINPECTLWVEIRENAAFIHCNQMRGAGGLPPGIAGQAVLLLSGGIDSPVAAWRMARRGLSILPVHFFSYPYTSEESKNKVLQLARQLSPWCGELTVRITPFTRVQETIRQKCPERLFTVLMRRSMYRIAAELANRLGVGALITGESLGQVASQTLEAIAVTSETIAIPVFRPLIGMDKEEIVQTARAIGTFETSILPFEDCCSVFSPKHPKTKPCLDEIKLAESNYDWASLEKEAADSTERIIVNAAYR